MEITHQYEQNAVNRVRKFQSQKVPKLAPILLHLVLMERTHQYEQNAVNRVQKFLLVQIL